MDYSDRMRVVVDPNRTVRRMTDDMKDYVEEQVVVFEITLGDGRVIRISEPYDDNTIEIELTLLNEREFVTVDHNRGADDLTWQLEVGPRETVSKEEAIFGSYESR